MYFPNFGLVSNMHTKNWESYKNTDFLCNVLSVWKRVSSSSHDKEQILITNKCGTRIKSGYFQSKAQVWKTMQCQKSPSFLLKTYSSKHVSSVLLNVLRQIY